MSNLAPSINPQNDTDQLAPVGRRKLTIVEKPKPEKVRVELNIERWPAIWQPSKSKNKPQLRVFERTLTLDAGSRVVARLEVSFNHLGTLTTEEQKMFYALIKQWESVGRPTSQVFFSDRLLARILQKKWGTNVIESVTKSLRKLRTVSLEWVNSYYDKTNEGRVLRQRQPMTFLGDLKIIERAEDGAVNSAKGYFRFDDHLLTNLLANHTKPLFLDEVFNIKTDIGLLLYSHIDLIMANKNRYERCTQELFEDLGLRNAEYRFMNKRKRALEMSLQDLVGRRISSGVIAKAVVEKTRDKKDYKIVIEKGAARAVAAPDPAPEIRPSGTPHHLPGCDLLEQQAHDLVCHFHKLFHGVDRHRPSSKELSQAVSLIASGGIDQARHLIDFSREAAERTKYKPQTFGGILQYATRAAADFEQARRARERAEIAAQERADRERLEAAYDAYVRSALDAYLADPAHEPEISSVLAEQRPLVQQKFTYMTAAQQEDLACQMVRQEIKKRLGLLSFSDFVARQSADADSEDAMPGFIA